MVHAGPSKLGSWFRMTSSSFKLIYVLGLVPVCSLCTLLGHARFLLVAAYLPICSSFLVVANRHQIWCEMLSEINSVFLAIRHESCATSHLALSYYQSYYIGKFFGPFCITNLTANIFESGPMPTPLKFLDSSPVIPSC